MSFIEANGFAVQSANITFRTPGYWEAVLRVDAETTLPAEGEEVVIIAPGARLVGSALKPGTDLGGQASLRVLGGSAKWLVDIPARAQTTTTVRLVLGSILTDAGATLAASVAPSLLDQPMARWTRSKGDPATALDALSKALSVTWRTLDDGTVWLGTDAAEENTTDHDVIDERPAEGVLEVAIEELTIRPGQTFRSGPVSEVVYDINATCRAKINRNSGGNRAAAAIRRVAERAMAGTKLHPPTGAVVKGQNEDDTLELQVDSPEMPSLSRVPIRHWLSGVTKCRVENGANVWVQFEGGDPQKPYACLFVRGRTTHVVIDGDKFEFGGDSAVADASLVETRLTAIETFLKLPGPIVGPAPLAPTPIASSSLFSKKP